MKIKTNEKIQPTLLYNKLSPFDWFIKLFKKFFKRRHRGENAVGEGHISFF